MKREEAGMPGKHKGAQEFCSQEKEEGNVWMDVMYVHVILFLPPTPSRFCLQINSAKEHGRHSCYLLRAIQVNF